MLVTNSWVSMSIRPLNLSPHVEAGVELMAVSLKYKVYIC